MTNTEARMHSSLGHSSFLRHSDFGIRHLDYRPSHKRSLKKLSRLGMSGFFLTVVSMSYPTERKPTSFPPRTTKQPRQSPSRGWPTEPTLTSVLRLSSLWT